MVSRPAPVFMALALRQGHSPTMIPHFASTAPTQHGMRSISNSSRRIPIEKMVLIADDTDTRQARVCQDNRTKSSFLLVEIFCSTCGLCKRLNVHIDSESDKDTEEWDLTKETLTV